MKFKSGQLTEKYGGEFVAIILNNNPDISAQGYIIDDDENYIHLSASNNPNEIDASILKSAGLIINKMKENNKKTELDELLNNIEEPENETGYN